MAISLDQRLSTAREMQKLLRDGYAQMQNAMSAQTVAFNLKTDKGNDAEISPPEIEPPVEEKLDQFATIVNEPPISPNSDAGQNSNPVGDKTEQMNFAELAGKTDDSESNNSEPKQADVKTEVFLGASGALSEIDESGQTSFEDSTNQKSIPFVTDNSNGESIPSEAPSAFDSVQLSADSAAEGYNFSPSEDFSNVEEVYSDSDYSSANAGYTKPNHNIAESDYAGNSGEYASTSSPPKESDPEKKGAFIAGGVFLFLILLIGAGGAGWYFYNNSKETVEEPQTTPQTESSALPTPEPTADAANKNNETKKDVSLTDDPNADNTNNQPINTVVVTNPTATTPTPFRPTPTPFRPTPTPYKPPTTPTQTPKPPPPPTPKPATGGDIVPKP